MLGYVGRRGRVEDPAPSVNARAALHCREDEPAAGLQVVNYMDARAAETGTVRRLKEGSQVRAEQLAMSGEAIACETARCAR